MAVSNLSRLIVLIFLTFLLKISALPTTGQLANFEFGSSNNTVAKLGQPGDIATLDCYKVGMKSQKFWFNDNINDICHKVFRRVFDKNIEGGSGMYSGSLPYYFHFQCSTNLVTFCNFIILRLCHKSIC